MGAGGSRQKMLDGAPDRGERVKTTMLQTAQFRSGAYRTVAATARGALPAPAPLVARRRCSYGEGS